MRGFRKPPERQAFPKGLSFRPKPAIALAQIRRAMEQKLPMGVVLADAAYGNGTQFRAAISELGLQYAVAIESSTTIWEPGQRNPYRPSAEAGPWRATQKTATECKSSHVSAKQLALDLALCGLERDIGWRSGDSKRNFAIPVCRRSPCALPIAITKRTEPHPEEWLLIEWPKPRSEPAGILVVHFAGQDFAEVSGENCQATLDHRTRL